VLNALDRLKLRDNTIIVYTSDHGELLGEHGMWAKSCFFEGAVHMPLIISFPPKFARGRRTAAFVEHIDLFPTLAEACGLHIPISCMGKSLLPLLEGQTDTHKKAVFSELHYYSRKEQGQQTHRAYAMLRSGAWKFIYNSQDNPELYNLENDPHEFNNVADNREHRKTAEQMQKQLLEHFVMNTGHRSTHPQGSRALYQPTENAPWLEDF